MQIFEIVQLFLENIHFGYSKFCSINNVFPYDCEYISIYFVYIDIYCTRKDIRNDNEVQKSETIMKV